MLFVAGDAVLFHGHEDFKSTRRGLGDDSLVFSNAEHGLEVTGDPDTTLAALRDRVEALRCISVP